MGVYILRPHAAGILYAPPFYTPPTPRRVFSGVGVWGCIKFGPVFKIHKIPPPLKRGIRWAWRLSCRKNAEIPCARKTGAAISGPRIAGKTFYGHEAFSSEMI